LLAADKTRSEERIGEIESLFRDVNEQIAAAAGRFEVPTAVLVRMP
jgi:hypothetical protein